MPPTPPSDGDTDILMDLAFLSRLVVGIGEVAQLTGVPQRKIRYWEEKGILQAVASEAADHATSTRKYDYLNIKKIILLQELLEDGYSLEGANLKVTERLRRAAEVFQKLALKATPSASGSDKPAPPTNAAEKRQPRS